MVKQCLASLLAASMLAGALGGLSLTAAATDEKEERMELKTWYTAPAADDLTDTDKEAWQKEGTPLGNGNIGGMVYGGVDKDRILINEKTVWSGGPGASSKYDSGISDDYTADEMKANLQKLRRRLQDMVTDFTNNKSAYLNDYGKVVAKDYGSKKRDSEKIDVVKSQSKDEPVWEDAEMQELIMTLRGEKNFFGSYQMLSDVFINDETGTDYSDYTRSLDLRTALNTVQYKKADGVTYTKEYFVNNPSNVLVVRLTADKKGALTRTFEVKTDQPQGKFSAEGDTITMTGRGSDQGSKGLRLAQQLKVIPTGGTLEITVTKRMPKITVTGADEILLILSAGTNYQQPMDGSYDFFSADNPLDAVAARVNAAAEKGYDELLKEHIADYNGLFGRVEFALDGVTMPKDKTTAQLLAAYKTGEATDAEARYLELLYYQFGRYLLIASSRDGKNALPANLQGIWADHLDPPWSADYHTNINVQMNYWLAEQTNLSECHIPLLNYTTSLKPYGEKTAQYYYCKQDGGNVRGWTIGHENNVWGNTAPGIWYWGYYFPAAAAWMCQHYWEHYRFTMDKDFLAENFDTMLSAALFWVDNLWTDERDNTLVANPSYSPEHGPYSLGASCDQEVIWELFNEVTQAAKILGITDEQKTSEIAEVQAAMDKLYLPKIGLGGEYLEWKDETKLDLNGDNGHRHVNQLYALHPGTLVVAGRSEDDDKAIAAMKKTLSIRGDSGTGWSKAWKINFWARLRDGDHAETMVNQILKQSTFDNLFDFHPPYQIDGNLGATAGMTEMLLQSQGDSIDLLAALPSAWATGSVRGLKARGNFTVDMTWADKALTGATIVANVGGDCTLNYKNLSYATVTRKSDGKEVALKVVDKNTVTFASEAGETYVVTPGAPAVTYGDANGDETVDTADAVLVLQKAANLIADDAIDMEAADVNADGEVDTADAVLILQKSAGLVDKFPAEK